MNKGKHKIDGKLVLDYQSGDCKALPILVKRWHKVFCEKAYWLVKDADVAKDIAQDTWNTIIDKMNTLKDPYSFASWSSRIVYTKSLDWLRTRNKNRGVLEDYKKSQNVIDNKSDEEETLEAALLKAINSLPTYQQMVIRLFYTEDYSLKEMSTFLDISVGTAKSRLFHARENLKELLKK